jgi:microcystin-dependent protein
MSEMPQHTHIGQAASIDGTVVIPTGNLLARSASQLYAPPNNLTPMSLGTVTNVGGSQAHLNMQPFLALTFCIALSGIFPSPN